MSRLVTLFAPPLAAVVLVASGAAAVAQEPSMLTKLDRDRAFLGDAVRYTVELRNVETTDEPALVGVDGFDVEYLGASTSSQVFTRFVNGRRVVDAAMGVTHTFELRARAAGTFEIPAPTVEVDGAPVTAATRSLTVVAPQDQEFVKIRTRARRGGTYPLQPFTVELNVFVKRLPAPYADDDPLGYLDAAPRLTVPWADAPAGTEAVRELRDWLSPYLARQDGFQRSTGFTMNDLTMRGGGLFSILDRPQLAVFDLGAKVADATTAAGVEALVGREGDYFVYTLSRRFVPLRAGTLEFDAASVKGSFIVDVVDRRGVMEDVFVRAAPLRIEVDDAPEVGRPTSFSGAFGRDFAVRTRVEPTRARVGDPLSLTVEIAGQGNVAEIDPPDLRADPAFAAAFAVEEPTVTREGGALSATYAIRANGGDVTEVPPVAFAWFDLDREAYEETASKPLPVEIEEISALGATDIVQFGEGGGRRADVTRAEGMFGNIVDARALEDDAVDGRLVLAVPPTLLAVWLLVALGAAAHRRRTGDPRRERRRRAAARVRERLAVARDRLAAGDRDAATEGFAGALRGLVADAAGAPEAGLTARDVVHHLTEAGVEPPVIERVQNVLESIDGLRYGGGGEGLSDDVEAVATELLAALKTVRGVS